MAAAKAKNIDIQWKLFQIYDTLDASNGQSYANTKTNELRNHYTEKAITDLENEYFDYKSNVCIGL